MSHINRRSFLQKSILVGGAGLAGTAAACSLTPAQTEGPFYPVRNRTDEDWDLTQVRGQSGQATGELIELDGLVQDQDCLPVHGAIIEIWQASANGRYDHPGDAGNPNPLDPNFQYWGQAITDEQGRYLFRTIMPGNYEAAPGWIRPSHIHFKVVKRGFHELTSQLYFHGNPYNETDRILRSLPPEERNRVIVTLSADPERSDLQRGRFDVIVRRV